METITKIQVTKIENGITFKLNDTVMTKKPECTQDTLRNIISNHDVIKKFKGRKILHLTQKENSFKPLFKNGFVGAVWDAYCNHYNLKIRPDDVWIALSTSFAKYVEKNAEKLRSQFVNHEGKVKLIIPLV